MSFPAHVFVYGALGLGVLSYGTWALVNSTVGYPYQLWFNDMMDAQTIKAYEEPMRLPPEGAVSQNRYVANADRMTEEGQALSNPYTVGDEFQAKGEWSYVTYCAPCHGVNGNGQGTVTDNSSGKRFQVPAPALAGAASAAKVRSDGYIYLTIRNGGAIMPAYHWAMTDEEIWATVHYVRNLEGNK